MSYLALPVAGYTPLRMFTAQQSYRIVPAGEIDEGMGDRLSSYFWDWRPSGKREFYIFLAIKLHASKDIPEEVEAMLIGDFRVDDGEPAVPFDKFAFELAPTLMFPYLREVISSLTVRGLRSDPYYLPPFDIREVLAAEYSFDKSAGIQILRDDKQVAEQFDFPVPGVPPKKKRIPKKSAAK